MMRHARSFCVKSVWNSTIRHISATPPPTIKGELKLFSHHLPGNWKSLTVTVGICGCADLSKMMIPHARYSISGQAVLQPARDLFAVACPQFLQRPGLAEIEAPECGSLTGIP